MIGGPLASAPLGGLAGLVTPPVVIEPPKLPEPGQPFDVKGFAYRWWVSVLVGGSQVAGWLTGRMEIDREEGAAAVANFSLYYPPGADVPTDLGGAAVLIDYASETGGETVQARRFTGVAVEPAWDAVNRVMSMTCSDQLQHRVEGMAVADIDALIGGDWTTDVYDAVDGRSRWDYAGERLETRPVALDIGPDGAMRVTSWYAGRPAALFGPGSTIYQSVSVELGKAAANYVELAVDYRYSRLWQRNDHYGWAHPGTSGHGGMQGFCDWRSQSTDLPDVDMIEQATEGAGMKMLPSANYQRVPPTTPDPCGTGAAWINRNPDLLLAADWTGARRWVQSITEKYAIVLSTPLGEVEATRIISRQSAAFEIEDKRADEWTEAEPGAPVSGVTDLRDHARRDAVLRCTLNKSLTTLVSASRGTTVSWQVPTPMAVMFDLVHTLELGDQVQARGKVRRIVDEFDFDSGSAVTTLSLAIMQGGGTSDALVIPARPVVPAPGNDAGHPSLSTQLGMRNESPIYQEELDGFAGNYDDRDDDINPDLEEFPRRFSITASEIPAEQRDEREVPVAAHYRVSIPNDRLVL